MSFTSMWDALAPVGRQADGGYGRFAWSDADLTLREWFAGEAAARGLDLVDDGNGNLLAWRGDTTRDDALLVGSHLDSVPGGGAFDGPLGVVSSFAAIDDLDARGVELDRPLVVGAFADEEGARFGIACAGSRLMTGSLDAGQALGLRDRDGLTLAEVLRARGRRPEDVGPRPDLLGRIGTFVELHVEQGRALDLDDGAAVGVGSAIWPHGRYRFTFTGRADHAGTTPMDERQDPMLTYAMTVLAANKQARLLGARATFGRVEVDPNGTNAIPSQVRAWMDARAADEGVLEDLVARVTSQAADRAGRDGTAVETTAESVSAEVAFDAALAAELSTLLDDAPVLPTGAGHDAGVLARHGVPTAMLFVRNPTGVSHSPHEHADETDCLAGVDALSRTIEHLAGAR
ncbi:MAG: allantoate amidohydrolase [Nocardioidaceae bacterium]|nr:allantoate amidohydrolase [Nocardioidaceae bacterium]